MARARAYMRGAVQQSFHTIVCSRGAPQAYRDVRVFHRSNMHTVRYDRTLPRYRCLTLVNNGLPIWLSATIKKLGDASRFFNDTREPRRWYRYLGCTIGNYFQAVTLHRENTLSQRISLLRYCTCCTVNR